MRFFRVHLSISVWLVALIVQLTKFVFNIISFYIKEKKIF